MHLLDLVSNKQQMKPKADDCINTPGLSSSIWKDLEQNLGMSVSSSDDTKQD